MDPINPADAAAYAAREAMAPALGDFSGGDAGSTLLFLILVAGIAALVYLIMERHRY